MRTYLFVFLVLSIPAFAHAQFTIGQTSGPDITYFDFPDTSICSFGLQSIDLDIDGDLAADLAFQWGLGPIHQNCWSRGLQGRLVGGGIFGALPDSLAVGNVLDAQQPFIIRAWADIINYCPDDLDSTFIHWIDWDYFGPGQEGYLLFHMDTAALDFAWVRVSTDTAAGNYCITFKDAARYTPPVSAGEALPTALDLEVYPTLVKEDLWLQAAVDRPAAAHLRYFSTDGRVLGREALVLRPGSPCIALSPPGTASGLVLLEIESEGRRKLVKLLFQE